MNKLKLNVILVLIIFSMTNCSKNDIFNENIQFEAPKEVNTLQSVRYWQPASCTIIDKDGKKLKGTMCDNSICEYAACPSFKPCIVTDDNNINQCFTEREISLWETGENIFKTESKYYIDHHDFFIKPHHLDLCNHPDSIIENLIRLGL